MMKGVGLEIYFSNLSFLEGVTLNKLSQKAQKRLIIFAFTIVPLTFDVFLLSFSENGSIFADRLEWNLAKLKLC